jgi:protein-S-isoprenylcysteine O-methyltransferase Ste14
MRLALPFVAVGVAANITWPAVFRMGTGLGGLIAGIVLHPLYTFVALLVLPGAGLVLDTWLGFALGAILHVATRIFSPREELLLEKYFPTEYPASRDRVLLPWLRECRFPG